MNDINNIKVTYATRTTVPSDGAQSKQIYQMCAAFSQDQSICFHSITGGKEPIGANSIKTMQTGTRLINIVTLLIMIIRVHGVMKRSGFVFTRDIIVAVFCVLVRNTVVYEVHNYPSRIATFFLNFTTLKNYILFVCTTKKLKFDLINRFGVDETRVSVESAAISLDRRKVDVSNSDVLTKLVKLKSQGKTVFVHTGNIKKGGVELFEVIAKEIGTQGHVLHVGGTDDDLSVWRKKFRDRGCDNISMYSSEPHENALELQRRADVLFYFNSKSSYLYDVTSPLKLYEYLGSGVPVISSIGGATDDIVNDAICFLFDEEIEFTLREAVQKSLDPNLRSMVVRNSMEFISNGKTWEDRVKRIIHFFMSHNA